MVITHLDTGAVLSLAAARPDAVLGIGGEAWVVSSGGRVLSRYRGDGAPLGDPVALPAAPASAVVPRRAGAPGVAVAGRTTVVADDHGVRARGRSGEPVIPVAGGVVARNGDRLVVRGQREQELAVPADLVRGSVVCGGAALPDGAVAVELRGGAGHHVIAIDAAGAMRACVRLTGVRQIAWVEQRGHAVLLRDREIEVIDLADGRSLAIRPLDAPVEEVAIDEAGTHLVMALSAGSSELEVVSYPAWLGPTA